MKKQIYIPISILFVIIIASIFWAVEGDNSIFSGTSPVLQPQINIQNFNDKQIVRTDVITIRGKVNCNCSVKINGENTSLNSKNEFSKEIRLEKGNNMINIDAEYNGKRTEKSITIEYNDEIKNYVVYINWDGFAWYYYELANKDGNSKTPFINELAREGVLFTNAYTGIPSITNPMQTAIVCGAWPETTGNCYRYYDKKTNKVVQFGRENKAETIAEAVKRQGLNVASVQQFILENRGTKIGDASAPYIQDEGADYSMRFDTAIKLIKGEPFGNGVQKVQIKEIPDFIAIYMDDLDGIGHNGGPTYGVAPAATEKDRLQSILKRLGEMDAKLEEFVQACKDRGIYDNMTFILTADHGMAPFGQQALEEDEYGHTRLLDLIGVLENLGYKIEVLDKGQGASPDTDIVIVGVGLEVQVSFTKEFSDNDIKKIVDALKDEPYIGKIMTKDEMKERGVMEGFADMIISPKPPYGFMPSQNLYIARGQHDSLDDTAQHIFSIMWGRGVKQGYTYHEKMYNIDFARTMTTLLGIDGPKDATGQALSKVLLKK